MAETFDAIDVKIWSFMSASQTLLKCGTHPNATKIGSWKVLFWNKCCFRRFSPFTLVPDWFWLFVIFGIFRVISTVQRNHWGCKRSWDLPYWGFLGILVCLLCGNQCPWQLRIQVARTDAGACLGATSWHLDFPTGTDQERRKISKTRQKSTKTG